MSTRRVCQLLLSVGFFAHLVLGLYSARVETPTVDEYAHMPAGLSYWRFGEFALYSKNPPLAKLWMTWPVLATMDLKIPSPVPPYLGWGPWVYGAAFESANSSTYFDAFFLARAMILILSLGTAVLLWIWGRDWFGELPAALVTFGFLLSPTILAHAHLATMDVACMLSIFTLFFLLVRGNSLPLSAWAAAVGVSLGVALATKFTAVVFLPWIFLIVIWRWRRRSFIALSLTLVYALIVINTAYGFKDGFRPAGEFKFESHAMQSVSQWLPNDLPMPLPKDLIIGFDGQNVDNENGEFSNYLFGEWRREGWWYYYIITFLAKENVITIGLLLLAPLGLAKIPAERRLHLLLPPMILLFVLCFLTTLDMGVRYLIPTYPFIYLMVASGLSVLFARLNSRRIQICTILLAGGWLFSAVMTCPEYLGYFNPVARFAAEPSDLLLDSNLDWGQDLFRSKEIASVSGERPYLLYFGHVSPALYGIKYQLVPDHPVRGTVVVSANFFKGMSYVAPAPEGGFVQIGSNHLNWLRRFTPVGRVGSLLVFDTRAIPGAL
jgi:4-amino-4-deoxy-L-arabinose transferase-like glycosyltransferase